jgi:hypothetical protein
MQFLKLRFRQPEGRLRTKNRNKTKCFHGPIIQRDGNSIKRILGNLIKAALSTASRNARQGQRL